MTDGALRRAGRASLRSCARARGPSGLDRRARWAPAARVAARVITGGGRTWKATPALRAARWGGAELPLPAGDYALRIGGEDLDHLTIAPLLLPGLRAELTGGILRVGAAHRPRAH